MVTDKESLKMQQTILAVDDTPENLDVLRMTFGTDYRLKMATDGKTALQIAESKDPPDIILLDVMMPGMDGFEICRQLKQNPRTMHIPVIFVTAMGAEMDERRGLDLGAVDYLQKPISPALARVRIRNHLALYDQRRELEIAVRERTAELEQTRLQIIYRLGNAAELKDNETSNHLVRMGHFSRLIALHYGLDEGVADIIFKASPMHDVGKIGIPDSILLKPGKLTEEEWVVMRKHPLHGSKIIGRHTDPLLLSAHQIALYHHEKWNGTGYPSQLSGEEIPVEGRIVALSDVFDALTSERPYKKAWTVRDAVDEIEKQRGAHFDPLVVDAFQKALPEMLVFKDRYKEGSIANPWADAET
jgi:putative two-component system response regulator